MSREIIRSIYAGDIEKFDNLIRDKYDVNMVTEQEKWNLLHRALMSLSLKPNPRMIKHLIDCGIDVNALDYEGNTPLHYAARLKMPDIIKILLDGRAEIDMANNKGCTPLREMLLTRPHNKEAIEMLLAHGANIEHPGIKGITVKDYVNIIAHGENSYLKELFDNFENNKSKLISQ